MSFLFPHRIGRLSYLIRSLVCTLAVNWLFAHFEELSSFEKAIRTPWFWLPTIVIIFYWLIFVIYARSRDVGMQWFWLLLLLIPGVDIGLALVLLFSKSNPVLDEKEPNKALVPLPTSVTDPAGQEPRQP